MVRVAALLCLTGCGRIGYEEHQPRAAADGAMPDAAGCPSDTTETSAGSNVCIELVERGEAPWVDARDACAGIGRRLCANLEWYDACLNAVGVVDMIDGPYEWVAEESGGVAEKRGTTDCEYESVHEIYVDAYEFRCCIDKP